MRARVTAQVAEAKAAPAPAAKTTLSTEMWLGRSPERANHRAVAAAHLVSRARIGRRVIFESLIIGHLLIPSGMVPRFTVQGFTVGSIQAHIRQP